MTIKVTIKNDETRPRAVIGIQPRSVPGSINDGPELILTEGADATIYVHSGRELLIREVSNG